MVETRFGAKLAGWVGALAGLALTRFTWSLFLASVIAILQTAESRMLGRVTSLFAVILLGGNAAGGPVASFLATAIGPRAPFVLGSATAAAAAITLASRARSQRPVPYPP